MYGGHRKQVALAWHQGSQVWGRQYDLVQKRRDLKHQVLQSLTYLQRKFQILQSFVLFEG